MHCNNVSVLRSYQDKSDALKIRLLNEMVDEDNRLAQQALAQEEAEQKRLAERSPQAWRDRHRAAAEGPAACRQGAYHQESLYQNGGTGSSWRLESAEDVDKYLDALRQSLLKELADDSIVNVEL